LTADVRPEGGSGFGTDGQPRQTGSGSWTKSSVMTRSSRRRRHWPETAKPRRASSDRCAR